MELSKAVAVVTGASRGLGAGMAATFAQHGLRLGLCARSAPEPPPGAEAESAVVDVTDPVALEEFAARVVARFGTIDLWVNNAGLLEPIGPLADADVGDIARQVDVNVTGTLLGSRVFARHVRSREGEGLLINMTSGASTTPYEGWATYCATKAAVDIATAVIAREEMGHGLRAYAMAPGVVDTDMQRIIRSTSPDRLPSVGRFVALKEAEAFNSPPWIARHVLDLLTGERRPDSVVFRVPDEPGDKPGEQPVG